MKCKGDLNANRVCIKCGLDERFPWVSVCSRNEANGAALTSKAGVSREDSIWIKAQTGVGIGRCHKALVQTTSKEAALELVLKEEKIL